MLGDAEIERALHEGSPLLLFHDVVRWLRGEGRGAVPVDWRRLGEAVDGVRAIQCARQIAPAVYRATRPCRPTPQIFAATPAEARHAA